MSARASTTLSIASTLRLGLFQACLGALSVVFAGMLNRVMISELAFPGLLVGGALAFEQFVSPSRVIVGQISDAYPIAGRRRVPYVLIGVVLLAVLAVLAVPLIFQVAALLREPRQPQLALGIGALCGLMAGYGLAVSLASTPYLALVIDRTDEQGRPRATTIIWSMLTVGIVVGAITIGLTLRSLDGVRDPAMLQSVLQTFMVRASLVVVALTVLATWGMEPRGRAAYKPGSSVDDALSLPQAWALIRSSRQVLLFFGFLALFTLGLFLQDPILESYGAEVFGMPIAATASLNAFWGMGTLVGLALAGLWIIPRLGKVASARLGCRLIAASLALMILVGALASVPALQVVMVVFGLAAGIGTNAALCLMLDLTLPQAAGTFVGLWGLAQAMARAMGKVLGGGLLDLGRLLPMGAGPFPAFALVLVVELLVVLLALLLLERLNLRQFREDTGSTLTRVIAMEVG
ncbi:MAG: BCD family MFS transporter [Cyanobacteriota bacterium]|nr:BCD family MFS transporter [Cyanobacteriota bacterium]